MSLINVIKKNNNKGLNLVEIMVSLSILSIIILAAINTFYFTNIVNSNFEYNQLIKQKLNYLITKEIKKLENNNLPSNPNELLNLINSKKNSILNNIKQEPELKAKNINIKDLNFKIKVIKESKNENEKIFLASIKSIVQYSTPKYPNRYLIVSDQMSITVSKKDPGWDFRDPNDHNNNLRYLNISSPI